MVILTYLTLTSCRAIRGDPEGKSTYQKKGESSNQEDKRSASRKHYDEDSKGCDYNRESKKFRVDSNSAKSESITKDDFTTLS
ncbi:hypothetical protein CBR_g38411 [Chara braunii]|uniref:Uncharacterized protein n=1 Tax=Chara braunii TaxID=69332 RepID=A0A388JNN3_CHABU|nr:hypothetical protein CBR_g38411 [Chara braunii]|eukprot:GBG59385.1 hypothetical protein CBR_g38411 [Chara braunii]